MLDAARRIVGDAVTAGVTPGGVVAVRARGAVEAMAFGRTHADPGAGEPVTVDTVYDVASLTKPVASLAVFLRLWEEGRADLATRATELVPEL
ncbi:MAG TPA: serine hydrolase domain-containing protein, partial [Kofleriaceae bacterium]|nr:serine hydrolase domain-containing protein [Kofleriaceae bacterium]